MKIVGYDEKYAQVMADMWNASDEGWPGGLTRGVPMTPDRIKETERKVKCYGRFIIMEKGRAIGYVRVNPYFEEKEAAYVSWLNIVPTHHGKSYGRKLLCRSVDCTTEQGLERLDLHTWPGNMKALPAYKKTGFFWVPKTDVYMQNYVPTIMRFPPAKAYFEEHDWYRTLQRKIDLEEDDRQVEGMNVFPYNWREGKDRLTVWIDRESRGITGFENNDLKVFVKLDRHDVLTGMSWKVTWTVTNKTQRKMSCSLKATPPKGVTIRAKEKSFILPAGKSKDVSSTLKVSLEAEEKPWDERSDSVLTRMRIDRQTFVLKTGLRTKQAIEIGTEPRFISVVPGKKKEVHVNLKSNLKKRVKGLVRFEAVGVDLDRDRASFTASAEGKTGIPLTIVSRSPETACYAIKAWTEFAGGRTKKKTLKVRSIGVHGAVADVEDEHLVAENAQVRVVANRKGAWMDLYDKSSRERVIEHLIMRVGPPFWPSELSRLEFKMKARNEKGLAIGTLTAKSEEREGLSVSLEVRMSGSNLVQIVPIFENRSREPHRFQVQFAGYREMFEDRMTIPSKYGTIQEEVIEDEFPDWMEDIPKSGYFSESWLHSGNEDTGLGVIWDQESASEVQISSWGPQITFDALDIGPGERKEAEPIYLVPAATDWRGIRKSWLQLASGIVELDEKVSPQRVLRVETDPKPLALENESGFKFTVRNYRNKKVDARIRIDFPPRMRASKTRFQAKGLCLDSPLDEKVRLYAKDADPGVYFAKARFSTPLYDDVFELPIVVVGKPGKVSVRERRGKTHIDNGVLSYVVAPDFAGSLVSLKWKGAEYLSSAYPEPSQLSWFRPWHGGVSPYARKDEFPGKLYKERFTHEKVRRGVWKGVKIVTRVRKDEKLKGLVVSTEFLTRPMSNVVAILQEFRNAGKSSLYFHGGCMGFFQVGGSRRTSAHFSRSGWRLRKWAKVSSFSISDNRTIVITDSRRKESICFVSPSRRCKVMLFDLAREGKHVVSGEVMPLKPGESRRVLHYVVLSTTPNEAKKYHVLADHVDDDLRG